MIGPSHIAALRAAYGSVQDIPHLSPGHHKLVALVERLSPADREAVENGDIRWLSPVARNVRLGDPLALLPGMLQHVRDQGRGYL